MGAQGTDAGEYSANFAEGTVGTVDKTEKYKVTVANNGKLTINKRTVTLTSDSQYVINGIEKGWAKAWRARGWRKADKSPALNADLWARLLDLLDVHTVTFVWVRGHAGHPYNERCDRLATAVADSLRTQE